MPQKHPKQPDVESPYTSAQVYLSKLQEFSQSALARDSLGADEGLDKTLFFIKEILQADCIVLGEIINPDENGLLRGIINEKCYNISIDKRRAVVLTGLSKDIQAFSSEDDGAREEVTILLDGFLFTSGTSVPIPSEKGSRGILAVYFNTPQSVSESRTLFLQSMSNVISHFLQSRDLISQINLKKAKHIIDAKREWEGTVDALQNLVVVLDKDARVIRVNRTIQYWDIGSIDSQLGKHVGTVITALTGGAVNRRYPDWEEIWERLHEFQHIEWEVENADTRKVLRFSVRKINKAIKMESDRKHQGYAVLVAEDITQTKLAEKRLKKYTNHLEDTLRERNRQLEELNKKLNNELNEHKKNKQALLKSEERYSRLFQHSLSGICQLEGGRILFYNDKFLEIFSYPREILSNMPFVSLIHEDDRQDVMSLCSSLADSRRPKKCTIARAKDIAGRIKWLVVRFDIINIGSRENIIVNAIDITRQKSVEISLRESEKRLQKISCQLLNAQEVERKRLALELHDGLLQSLSAIKYSIEDISHHIGSYTDADYEVHLATIVENIRHAIDETRCMAMDLRPSMLDDMGVIATINWFCRQYQETYKHIRIEKQILLEENAIPDNRKIAIYRILQEALNNVAKHSNADVVRILLRTIDEGFTQLQISDNGCGICLTDKAPASIGTLGLSGMQERVELTGGTFLLSENSPCGVTIDVRWPGEEICEMLV